MSAHDDDDDDDAMMTMMMMMVLVVFRYTFLSAPLFFIRILQTRGFRGTAIEGRVKPLALGAVPHHDRGVAGYSVSVRVDTHHVLPAVFRMTEWRFGGTRC